jgi:hypothetical protein
MLCLSLIIYSCEHDDVPIIQTDQKTANEYSAEVVVEWYGLIKTLTTETEGYTPPVAARAFGYTGVALYEGIVPGMPDKVSLSGKLTDLKMDIVADKDKTYHWPTVANAVLAAMTKHFYANTSPERLDAILVLETSYKDRFLEENGQTVYDNSVLLAEEVVAGILEWSSTDGGEDAQFNNFPSEYEPPTGPQYWVPTPPAYLPALQPYWGDNRPFLAIDIEASQPADPPEFSTDVNSVFYQRAMEVYTTVKNITPAEKTIAEFWSDDPVTTATPPGHSISILNQLIKKENLSLDLAVEAFAKLGIGVSDSFISCWNTKYRTVYPRPITYINEYIDPEWTTILPTPPFPEYTSGHSVQSGALAEIMTEMFGDDYKFTDYTHEYRTDIFGAPRTFESFYQLAEEAAISRMYGGIHFKEAIDLGLEQGYQIGRNVNALNLDK